MRCQTAAKFVFGNCRKGTRGISSSLRSKAFGAIDQSDRVFSDPEIEVSRNGTRRGARCERKMIRRRVCQIADQVKRGGGWNAGSAVVLRARSPSTCLAPRCNLHTFIRRGSLRHACRTKLVASLAPARATTRSILNRVTRESRPRRKSRT